VPKCPSNAIRVPPAPERTQACGAAGAGIPLEARRILRIVASGVPPLQTKKFSQTSEMNMGARSRPAKETVDTPVRIGARQHCQDGKQNEVQQATLAPE